MPIYKDRALRIEVTFPLEFIANGKSIKGTCENLSESGLLARFTEELEIWSSGEVNLYFGRDLIGIKVHVARAVDLEAGLSFRFSSDEQRQQIRDVIQAANTGGKLTEHL